MGRSGGVAAMASQARSAVPGPYSYYFINKINYSSKLHSGHCHCNYRVIRGMLFVIYSLLCTPYYKRQIL